MRLPFLSLILFFPCLILAQSWQVRYASADSLIGIEKYDQALLLSDGLIQDAKEQFGSNSKQLADAYSLQGNCLHDLNKYSEALTSLDQAIVIYKNLGKPSFEYAYTQHVLGRSLVQLNRLDKAESNLIEAAEVYEQSIGAENEFYLYALDDLLEIYRTQKNSEAIFTVLAMYTPLKEIVLGSKTEGLGEDYIELAELAYEFDDAYTAQASVNKAFMVFTDQCKTSEEPFFRTCLLSGKIYYESEDFYLVIPFLDVAEELLSELNLGSNKKNELTNEIHLYKGVTFYELDDYRSAIKELSVIKEKYSGENKVNVLFKLGKAQSASGLKEEALNSFQLAKNEIVGMPGNSDEDLANILNEMAVLKQSLADINGAVADYILAYDLLKGSMIDLKFRIMANLASLYGEMGKFSEAEEIYLKVLESIGNDPNQRRLSLTAMNNLGMLYMDWGEYSKCELLLNECLNISKAGFGVRSSEFANAANNLGVFYFEVGNYDMSVELFVSALESFEFVNSDTSSEYSSVLNNIGLLFMEIEEYEEALHFLDSARSIEARVIGEDHPDYAATLNNLSFVESEIGDKQKAKQYLERAMQIIEKHFGERHPDYVQFLMNLGILESGMGNMKQATATLRKSLGLHKEVYGEKHPNTAIAKFYLAKALSDQDKIQEAIPLFTSSIQVLQDHLNNFLPFLSEKEKSGFYNRHVKFFHEFFEFAAKAHEIDPALRGKAFDLSLSLKGMLLRSSRAMRNIVLNSGNPKLISVYDKWVGLKKRIAELSALPVEQRSADIDELTTQANTYEKQLYQMSDELGASNLDQTTWQQVKEKLKEHEAVIEFVTYKSMDTDQTHYMALVLQNSFEQPVLINLFEESQLTAIINIYGSNDYSYIKNIYNYSEEKKTPLYDLIWKPIEPSLKDCNRVFVSAAGLLHRVSMYAIASDKDKYLIDAYELVSMNSSADIIDFKGIESFEMQNITLMGGIKYDSEKSDKVVWEYLPGSKAEVEAINDQLAKKKKNIQFQTAENATETYFKEVAEKSDIVHVATHGFFFPDPQKVWEVFETDKSDKNEDIEFRGNSNVVGVTSFTKNKNPLMRSGLVFAGVHDLWSGVDAVKKDDGVLTAMEVSQLNLTGTELAVLSACETGLGEIVGDEGVYGLKRTFKIAGVKYLIISLWQVPDKETQEFMTLFYEKLYSSGTVTIDEAFEYAQRELRKKYEPYFWAAFVLIR
ncbi:MAG: CHAT domain-containing tetratricopeptide repeat protein [Crocinitomicaceae bacterium]|nr:CHAT domain-containing protein [Crocinitomicaceae bacterium]